ncbi:MAG: aminoglycoside phosphotransferase family protein [bacterium]|nr:aminoglycoside phosphotransferase family protein [bacterium]
MSSPFSNEPGGDYPRPVLDAIQAFRIDGVLAHLEALLRGHINQTWISTWQDGDTSRRYLHQRINDTVFQNVDGLMGNIDLVTRRLGETCAAAGYETLRLIPSLEGSNWHRLPDGPWRTYEFVENTAVFDRCSGPEQAYATARIFGWFHSSLAALDATHFQETIPDFFSPGHRQRQFRTALQQEADLRGEETKRARNLSHRRSLAKAEIEFALQQADLIELFEGHLASGAIPKRIVHGDTKLNNVLFDETTGKARCVVDLDTCMPGFSLYDFGDMVRFTAALTAEDECDLSQAGTSLEIYRALAGGYLECASDSIQPLERELLHLAGPLVSLVIGLRFLTDHLAGDVYFGVSRENHNLDRARVQFAQVAHMQRMRADMKAL